MHTLRPALFATLITSLVAPSAHAWDYEGHRIVNTAALAALPADFPAFVREPAAAERIAFLAGEPDRWRNMTDLPLKHCASPDHYFDYEQIASAGLDVKTMPDLRYVFMSQFAAGRAAHLAEFQVIDPLKNADHTAEWPGFAPWVITESYAKLKSGFSYLKVYQEIGTPAEIANAQANIIYIMGVMGHFVGDCSQPLHLSNHHNGWVGENPNGYTTWSGFHAWIDGGFANKSGIKVDDLLPRVTPVKPMVMVANPGGRDPMFAAVVDYITAQHAFVEPLYQLEKSGALKAEEATTSTVGKKFIEDRLLTGSQELAAIWFTAWKEAGPDEYLRTQLEKRRDAATPPPAAPPTP
ncbi:MAG: hypothetical protein ABIS50_19795 [Luteolibacter sp.]|uniref:hypothetical protein n=1 Tax=Luteolibacter sp. TaxID=1962973 RepID=UPI003266959C